MAPYTFLGYFFAISCLFVLFIKADDGQDENSLQHAALGAGGQILPANSLEDRKSAHYMEISRFYEAEMQKLIEKKYNEIAFERMVQQSDLSATDKNKLIAFSKIMLDN